MWNPIDIEFQNLFAHKNSRYQFKNNACTVIFGDNNDDKGMQNNGSGKTTLFEAVCIALTNESLRLLKKESFINRDASECSIIMRLENAALKKSLRIERRFFRGSKPAKVALYENEVLNTQIVSVNDANKRILELIGISREDLLRYFIISQDNHYTFFTASDSEKKEIMNRITSADMVVPVIERLGTLLKDKEAEYKQMFDEIDRLSNKLELLKEQRQELIDDDNTANEIARLTKIKQNAEEAMREYKQSVSEYESRIEGLTKELSDIEPLDTAELVQTKKRIQRECDGYETELLNNKQMVKKLNSELGLSITCPHCENEFIPESQLGLSPGEIREAVEQLRIESDAVAVKLKKSEKRLIKIKQSIAVAEKAREKSDDLAFQINRCKRQVGATLESIGELETKINDCVSQIKVLKNQKKDNKQLKGINERIAECNNIIDDLSRMSQPLAEEIGMIKFWLFNMGKSGFYTYLANKSVKVIEGITNSFLRKFGVDLSVLINGFKVLSSGELREKIDVFVLNDGITAESFISKSGGERGRVTLAGILGIQHLINLSTNGRGLNLLMLDEVFPGIDSLGQERIIKTLETLGLTILLITQNVGESFNNENTLYVVKTGGESRYVSRCV